MPGRVGAGLAVPRKQAWIRGPPRLRHCPCKRPGMASRTERGLDRAAVVALLSIALVSLAEVVWVLASPRPFGVEGSLALAMLVLALFGLSSETRDAVRAFRAGHPSGKAPSGR